MTTEHLTENQLTAYFGDSALEGEAKHAIGRHLLQCDFCLKRLPQPTTEQFWAALMTDADAEDFGDEEKDSAPRLKFISELFKQPKILVWSAGALAILLFFSAFILLNAVKSSEAEREIAGNFETAQPVFNPTGNEKIKNLSALPNAENGNHSPGVPTRIVLEKKSLATNNNPPKENSRTASRSSSNAKTDANLPDVKNVKISATRGGNLPKCGNGTPIDSAAGMTGESVVLKWEKIPNAAKYHLYVSDEEEILLDEFETEQGTSYVLKKSLDPLKTYKWKVVVTLENGETVIGDSQKFTVKELKFNQKKSAKKGKSEIRCSEDK